MESFHLSPSNLYILVRVIPNCFLPHLLDIQLTDGGGVVSFGCWLNFTPREDSWYSFLLVGEPQGHGAAGRIR
jgi:hypothetical protein